MYITRGVRFASVARLEKKHLLSNLAINTLSLCVIGFELMSLLANEKTTTMRILFPVATIIAPVFIIILSAHENSKRYLVHTERMKKSSQLISELLAHINYLNYTKTLTDEVLREIQIKYDNILSEFSSNHDDNVDYGYFRALHPNPFLERNNSLKRKISLQLRGRIPYYFNIWFIPIASIFFPLSLLIMSIFIFLNPCSNP